MGPRRRAVLGALVGATIGALAFAARQQGLIARWEYVVSDLHFRLRLPGQGPGDVIVVGITRECMEDPALGPLPWPRRDYAKVIRNLKALGASAICFDIFFPSPSPKSADGVDDDAELARAIREAGNVILPVFDKFRGTQKGVVGLQGSLLVFERAAVGQGHINVLPDPDGIVRRVPLRIGSLARSYVQLGVAGAALRRGGAVNVPTGPGGHVRVPWRPGSSWRSGENLVTFAEAYHGQLKRKQVEGKIVLIGQTAPGLPNADIINSPFGARFGLFCQADVAQGVMSGDFIRPWSETTHLAVLLLIGAALGAIMSTLRVGPILTCAAGVLAAETAASLLVFRASGILTELVPSFATVAVLLCTSLAYGLALKAAEARRWAQAMEVLRTTGLDPGVKLGNDAVLCGGNPLGIAGSLAATLQVPDVTPHTVLNVLAGALGARYAFMRFEGRDGLTRWTSTADDAKEARQARELAKALADLEQERGPSLVVPQISREPSLRTYADLAGSALVLRLSLGERQLGTVVLCGKIPTAISPSRRFGLDDLRVALALAPQASLLLDHARLHRGLYTALRDACSTLASAMSARDEYTSGHSARVAYYTVYLARKLELPEWCVEAVELGALLHDIGKIGMDEVILRGSSTLTDAERGLVRQHPGTGADIFSHMDELEALLPAIRHHHERYDGKGYPEGLAGDQIPLMARIVGIADSFDAMTYRRPYRDRAMSFDEACQELLRNAGTQFDPELARLFVSEAPPDIIERARQGEWRPTDFLPVSTSHTVEPPVPVEVVLA
ncbi:MAG: CHASE2 domain-containing protein [Armatimonadetes bacterium]|nr:CHASE2 domain-containing protein [Armatimonadota bacterium]